MNGFQIKCKIAKAFETFGINSFLLKQSIQKYGNNHIRVINYHHSFEIDRDNFIKQIEWYRTQYEIVGFEDIKLFLAGKKMFTNKPGLVITFDDGFEDNYTVAHQFLRDHKIPAIYMISYGLIGTGEGEDKYINHEQLKCMAQEGATIGCHTFTHHRMNISDDHYLLHHEIVDSKDGLEFILGNPVEIFCWCGGEESTYTKSASDLIRMSGYKYAFMTNSYPVFPETDLYQLDRSNIEASWPISLVKFQLNGIIDKRLEKKRDRVHKLTM